MSNLRKLLKLNPELIGLPLSVLLLIVAPVLVDYSGLDSLYFAINPDPAEQDRTLMWLEKLPMALIIPFFANFAAWTGVKYNRPDLWVCYRTAVILGRQVVPECEAPLYRYWLAYFVSILLTGNMILITA